MSFVDTMKIYDLLPVWGQNIWSAGEKRSRKNYYHEDVVGLNKSDFRGGQNLGKAFAGE